MKFKVSNGARGFRYVHGIDGPVMIPPGESRVVEFSDAEARSAAAYPGLTVLDEDGRALRAEKASARGP